MRLWHVIRVYHRSVHMAVTSETLAEHAGSVLRFLERKTHGSIGSVGFLVWSARLRMAGLRGLGGEDAILAAALNIHFGGPCWFRFWLFCCCCCNI